MLFDFYSMAMRWEITFNGSQLLKIKLQFDFDFCSVCFGDFQIQKFNQRQFVAAEELTVRARVLAVGKCARALYDVSAMHPLRQEFIRFGVVRVHSNVAIDKQRSKTQFKNDPLIHKQYNTAKTNIHDIHDSWHDDDTLKLEVNRYFFEEEKKMTKSEATDFYFCHLYSYEWIWFVYFHFILFYFFQVHQDEWTLNTRREPFECTINWNHYAEMCSLFVACLLSFWLEHRFFFAIPCSSQWRWAEGAEVERMKMHWFHVSFVGQRYENVANAFFTRCHESAYVSAD